MSRGRPYTTLRNGLCDRLLERLHSHLDEQGQIGWDVWCVDGTNIRATRLPPPVVERGADELDDHAPALAQRLSLQDRSGNRRHRAGSPGQYPAGTGWANKMKDRLRHGR